MKLPDDENLEQPPAHPHVPGEMASTTLTGPDQRLAGQAMSNLEIDALMRGICSAEACWDAVRPKLEKLAVGQMREMRRQCGIEDLTALVELRSAFQRQQSNYTRLYHAVIGGECTTCDERDICAIATSHREREEKAEAACAEMRRTLSFCEFDDEGCRLDGPSDWLVEAALSSTCGQNYVPIEDVKPLLEMLLEPFVDNHLTNPQHDCVRDFRFKHADKLNKEAL